jgi:hypothetical protein
MPSLKHVSGDELSSLNLQVGVHFQSRVIETGENGRITRPVLAGIAPMSLGPGVW